MLPDPEQSRTRIAPSRNLTERGSSRAMGDVTFASPWRSHRECASQLGVCAGYLVPGPAEQTILDAVLSPDRGKKPLTLPSPQRGEGDYRGPPVPMFTPR